MGGFKIDSETVPLKLMDEIGPCGEFLTSKHTLIHFRENWIPELISREPFEKWEQKGKKDLGTKANEKAHYILKHHIPHALEEKVKNELRKIVESQNRSY